MSTYELRPITEHSWILQKAGVRMALITQRQDGYHAMGTLSKKLFSSLDDLSQFLGGKVELQEPVEDESGDVLGNINGYPVKHQGVVPVEDSDTLPVYKRGKVPHSAGYYGIHFKNGWVTSYCPKLSTLEENEYIGPFRTKLEMLNAISQEKRRTIDL